ncbi:MAG: hypothetical protein IPJ07_14435 [Acidobacteria bacterium]|nr:hypothetical protein [Acidobacteriota bacterium]
MDVHPVIRGSGNAIYSETIRTGREKDEELLQHIESGDVSDLLLRILSQPDLEECFQSLSNLMGELKIVPHLKISRYDYWEDSTLSPDLEYRHRASLPALRLRKDQALALQRTANELMTRGQWDDSAAVFKRAIMAFYLCGDLQSVEDCRRSHDWQILYGGSLRQAENHLLDELEKPENLRSAHDPYWLALLLAIRQSPHARELLESLASDESRWTLQTVAELWSSTLRITKGSRACSTSARSP